MTNLSEVLRVMYTKFPATVIIIGVVNNEGHVMSTLFFPQRNKSKF